MRSRLIAIITAAWLVGFIPAAARNIVVTNDDGLTSNVVALYRALKAQGHDVIVSVPCSNQSGMGAAAYFSRPMTALEQPCLNGAAAAGDPAVGPMTRADLPAGDFFYVSGTPVMALLYGLDIAGQRRWGRAPDLVLSGPNEGQNVGAIILSSGTVGNAQYAALRDIPAIALSAGSNSAGDQALANPISEVVARRAAELVEKLDRQAGGGPLLPGGVALNVNFPDNPDQAEWRHTRIGAYNAYLVRFSDNMARDASPFMIAMAARHGGAVPQSPGLVMMMNGAPPTPEQAADESVVYRSAIAVTPMRAGYDLGAEDRVAITRLLRGLF